MIPTLTLHECRDDGVERALVAGQRVRRSGIEREGGAAVLQREPHAVHSYIRTKCAVVALNHGQDIAVVINHGEVRRVAPRSVREKEPAQQFGSL
jgi:hypothetical protein